MAKGKKIALAILVGIPLLCGLGGYGVMQALFGSAARTRNSELAKARIDGIPTTTDEVAKLTHVPDSENAAPIYRQMTALSKTGGSLNKDAGLISKGMASRATPKDKQAADEAITRMGPLIALAEQAAKYPHCDFRRNWSAGAQLLFPEYSYMKGAAKVVCFDALTRSKRGDWKGALDELEVAETMSRHIREEPVLIAMLVSISVEAIVEKEFQTIIDQHSHDAEFLAAAKRFQASFPSPANLHYGMLAELPMARSTINQVSSMRDLQAASGEDVQATPPNFLEKAFFHSSTVQNAFDAKLIHGYRLLLEDSPKDPMQWEKAEAAAKQADEAAMADHSVSGMLNQIMMPVFSGAAQAVGRQIAYRNLTNTALDLLQDRAKTGTFPHYLPKYGKESMDPFSGNSLIYRREGSGFILYSVGTDRVDNGGKENDGSSTGGFDDVFRIH